jgi:hypothetical protein
MTTFRTYPARQMASAPKGIVLKKSYEGLGCRQATTTLRLTFLKQQRRPNGVCSVGGAAQITGPSNPQHKFVWD